MKLVYLTLFSLMTTPLAAAELTSEYTRNDPQQDCELVDQSGRSEGDWSDYVCPGVKGYNYYISETDGRQAVTYGHARRIGMQTFSAFNYAHDIVEWRMSGRSRKAVPVAAIQRFYLANSDGDWALQILVVSKIGQPGVGEACVVGYVSANEGASANRRARELSNSAATFRCGRDKPIVEAKIRSQVPAL